MKDLFHLDPTITYLNHGAFGACPKEVVKVYQDYQLSLERNPTGWITGQGREALDKSRKSLANFLSCDHRDLVFVPNPTAAMNAVMKSINLQKGDEVLTTNQEYGALDIAWDYHCHSAQAKVVRSTIELPIYSADKLLDQFWSGLTDRTRVIFISHMTSATALVMPVADICRRARELGILCIVDGAHVPGHLDLDLSTLDPDIYIGANHKWLLSPKGNSFLYVRTDLQDQIDPLAISWGYQPLLHGRERFQSYHQYQGTVDFSAYLCMDACIEFRRKYGWEQRTEECRSILRKYAPRFAEVLGSKLLAPQTDEWTGQMASFYNPAVDMLKLKENLERNHGIVLAVNRLHDDEYIRISYQPYNQEAELDHLLDGIREILR